jgi:hypothetical protein
MPPTMQPRSTAGDMPVQRIARLLQRHRMRRGLRSARRRGEGLYLREWRFEGEDASSAEAVLAWYREVAAAARRPYGIAHFDLALAANDGTGTRRLSRRLSAAGRPRLHAHRLSLVATPAPRRAAALMPGDVAHAALA